MILGMGLLGCPPFLVPIAPRPSREDGVGMRSAPRKRVHRTSKPPNPVGRGRKRDEHPPGNEQSRGGGRFYPPPAARGQPPPPAGRILPDDLRGHPSVASAALTLSRGLRFHPGTQSGHHKRPPPRCRRRDAAPSGPPERAHSPAASFPVTRNHWSFRCDRGTPIGPWFAFRSTAIGSIGRRKWRSVSDWLTGGKQTPRAVRAGGRKSVVFWGLGALRALFIPDFRPCPAARPGPLFRGPGRRSAPLRPPAPPCDSAFRRLVPAWPTPPRRLRAPCRIPRRCPPPITSPSP